MAFDVDGARKAGYSDDEIAGFLSEQSGFDLAGARAAGYAPADVIGFLSTAAKPEPADKLNLGDPMGTGGSEIMAAAAPPSAGIVEQVARPNMLQQGFVDTVRNEVIGSLPAEKRLPALKELARAPGAYGIAAREILGDVEQENAYYVGKEANERQARKINASTPVPAAGRPRMAEGGRAAIVDATPGFADMARGDDEAAVAKTKTTAGILSAAQEGARKERQTTEARLQQPRTAEEWISDSGVYGKQGWALLRQVIANSVDPSSEWSAAINAEMKGLDAELTEKERFRREEVAKRVSGTDSEIRRFAIVLAEMANPTIGAQEIIKQLPLMASIMGLTIAGGVTGGLVVRGASAAFPTVALADAIGGGGITAAGKLAGGLVASRFGAGVAAGGDAAQGVYEELTSAKNRPLMLQNPDVLSRIGRGMSEDQAIKEVATNRARIAQGLAGAVGAALGGMGLEGQVARKVAGKATGDGAAKAFGKELSSELADELSTQAATNWQVGQVDPSRKITEGFGETAATTFVTTLPMAATSAVMGHQETNANPVDQAIAASRLSASGVEFGATRANEFFRSDADVGPAPRPQGARPVGDPVAAIQAAPTVDDAIRTAARAIDQTIDQTQNAGAAAAVDNIARILGTESTNVGSPAAVPGVAAPAGGSGAVDAAAGVGTGVGTAGVVRPAVDAGSVGSQASGGAVPLGAGQPGALSFAQRSAGPVQQITVTPAGTVTAVGDPQALMRLLKAAGVTSVIPSKDGVTVGKSQATMARKILDDFVAAPPENFEQDFTKELEQAYQADIKQQILQRRGAPVTQAPKPAASAFKNFLREVGIAAQIAKDIVGEGAFRSSQVLARTFRANGLNVDLLAQQARERGFLTDADINNPDDIGGTRKLVEMIQAEIRGERATSMDMAEETQGAILDRRAVDDVMARAAAIGFDASGMEPGQVDAALKRIERRLAKNRAAGVQREAADEARIEREAIQAADRLAAEPAKIMDEVLDVAENASLEDAMRALGFTEQEISDAVANESRSAQADRQVAGGAVEAPAGAAQGSAARGEGQARGQEGEGVGGESLDSRQVRGSGAANPAPQAGRAPGNAGAAAGDSGNRRGNPEGARNDRPQDLLGEAPNASQQEAARLRAEREAQQRRQQQQAPDAADFQMSGSDRAVDVGAAAGQRDLLAGAPDAGLSAADTQTVVATFRANGLDIKVADTQDDLPESAQRRMLSEGISGVRGLYDPATDTTWIVRSNLGSKEEAFFVGLHEAFHRGLGRTFGRDINAILGYIELNNKSVRDKAREYRDTYKMGRYEAIEEVLADMAGEGKASDLRGWDRLLAFLRQVIQSMARGIGVNIPVTDAMVEQLVAGIRKEGMRDTPAFVVQSNKGPMFLRVFHGTPHTVDKFSTDKIGTGEGAQAYGWGIYLASSRDVAEHYRKSVSDRLGRGFSIAGYVPTSPNEGLSNDEAVATKDLAELLVPNPEVVQTFGSLNVVGQGRVLGVVRRLLQNRKILDTVIPLVPVDVVNMLGGQKRSSNGLLDNPAMLVDLFPGNANDFVASDVQAMNVLAPLVAIAAAKVHTGAGRFDVTRAAVERAAADTAEQDQGDLQKLHRKIPQPSEFAKGNLYEVDIPEDGEYLLWDKPLSEQPQKVREALTSDTATMAALEEDQFGGPVMDQVTGRDFYRKLSTRLAAPLREIDNGGPRGWGGYTQTLNDKAANDKAASEALHAAGIRGIKYLDGVSRNKSLRDVKREFLAELPEDADFDEVMDLIGEGTFSPANEAILKALQENDWLGFDYPAQAISAALGGKLADFDASPALVKAVADAQEGGTFNYVIFDDADVEIAARFSRPTSGQEISPGPEFWRKIRAGEPMSPEEIANAYAQGTRSAAPRTFAGMAGASDRQAAIPGTEHAGWRGEVAGFEDYVTVGVSTPDGALAMGVVPRDLYAGARAARTTFEGVRDHSLATYVFRPREDGSFELGVVDPPEGSPVFDELQRRGYLDLTPYTDGNGTPYYRVPIGYAQNRAFLQEAIRRLGLHIGDVPEIKWPRRETGARGGIERQQPSTLSRDTVSAKFSRRFSSLRGSRPTASYVDATPRQQATLDAIDEGPESTDFDLLPAKEDINQAADAAFTDWEQERGIKYVPLNMIGPLTGYNIPKDAARIRRLADAIKESNTFEPIFVGIDPNGEAYIMEGQHRARALQLLGETHVPAQVIVSMEGSDDDYAAQPEAPPAKPTDYKLAPDQMPMFSRRQDGAEPDRTIDPWRVDLAPALSTAMRRWEAGRATDADLAAAVRAELDNRKAKREEATDRDRVRGADWLQERILRARRTGEMSTAEADLALWLLNRAPQVATDLGISIKSGDMTKPNGTYNVLERVVTSFTSKSNPNTLTHEILHHTERMMPEPVQNAIRKEWLKQLETEGKKVRTGLEQRIAQAEADPRLKRAVAADQQRIVLLDWMLEAARKGDADLASSLYSGFRDGISLKQVLPYELSSPSEFWAVNAAALVRKRAETGTSLWRQARQWLIELVQKAKSMLGLRSNAPVIRGLEAVLAGDGSFVTRSMIASGMREVEDQTDSDAFRKLAAILSSASAARDMLASSNEAVVNGLKRDAQSLSDFLERQAIGAHGGSQINVPKSVVTHVLKVGDNKQVLGAVVRAIPVDVVNLLRGKKLAPELLLRDKAMLENVLAVDGAADVSLAINKPSALALLQSVAREAAKIAALAERALEGSAALGANQRDSVLGTHRRSVTETEAFSNWFGDSKVVDAEGKPLVVYHGTDSVFTEFSRTGDIGHHFGTEIAARDRAARVGGAEVLVEPVTLSQVEKDSLSSLNGEIGGTPAADLYALLLRKLDSPRQNLRAQVEAMPADEIKKVKAEYLEQPDSLRFAERVDRAKAGEGFRVEVNGETVSTHRTVREANARAARLRERAATPMALYLRIENPIRLPDLGVWPAQEIAKEAGFSKREMERVVEAGTAEQQYEAVRAILESKGFDGIVYRNEVEHAGEDSYIAFRPEQIKSALGNRGTFDPANPNIMFARATANPTQAGTPAALTPQTSPWRDETGRLQFLPGAWLYEKFGPEVGGAVMGGATGAAAGPVGAVVGAVAGAASARLMLNRLELKAASPALRRALRDMKIQVAKAQETAAAVATEAMKLTEAERGMVSDLIEQEMAAGTVPPQHAVRLAAMINSTMGAQTDELVRLGMLSSESADMWRGKYLPRFYESKLRNSETMGAWADALRQLTGRPKTMAGIKGKHLRGRGMYETIPEAELPQWEQMGWEVRDPDYQPGLTEDGTVQVWRDFTRQERDSMGEIRDAGFRFVMGYMQTQRDIALGRMFEALAADPAMSSKRETEEFSVMVPDSTVPGTGAKRYGKLAGRWVSKDTLSHLSAIEEAQSEVWRMYRKALATWKEGKTSMNPVSHVNNVVSNLTMAHLAGVSYLRADKYIGAARDFATNAPGIQEAKDAGLFLGTMSDAELMQVLPEDLKALVRKQDSTATKVGRSAFNVMTFFLRRPMGWAYQAEDTFFRYLIYKDARERGLEPADAVDYAQKYIFTYDDLPKGARMIRDFGIPFFSYTFKAVPALLHTAMTHPLRMAMPAALLWAANAAAYAIAFGGDDDDSWEESLKKYLTDGDFRNKVRQKEKLEREHLPPWMKGTTALLTPKTVRLGMDEVTKLPVFIDVSRIIPGGDLFDVSPNAGGIPLPQPVTPSHPLFTTAVAMLGNKDLFFGKELVDANDTRGEATLKRMDWMWKQMTPAIALGNYHFERGMNALAQATGEEIRWMPEAIAPDAVVTGIGRDGLPVQPRYAAMQTFGIKARPIDLEMAEDIGEGQKNKMLREIDAEIRRLQRLNMKGAVADSVMNRKRDQAQVKKDRIRDNLTVDGEERP